MPRKDCGSRRLSTRLVAVEIGSLIEHEEVFYEKVLQLAYEIKRDGLLKYPILVEAKTRIILDGHHRYHALKLLGAKYVPVFLVDYYKDPITVGSWRKNFNITKQIVLKAGLSGKKLPTKTSRHILVGLSVPYIGIPLSAMLTGRGLYIKILKQ